MLVKIFFLFFLVRCMHCAPNEDFQAEACEINDFQCNSEATDNFLDKTASGNTDLDIKPYDPLIINSFNESTIDRVWSYYKNINVTGLRKQKLTQLKYDTVAKSAVFATTVDVNIVSDVEVDFEETNKKYSGTYIASGKAAITTTYHYQLKTDDKGVTYFETGPETIICEFVTFQYEPSKEFMDAILNDPYANKIYQENYARADILQKATTCDIVKKAYAFVIDAARKLEAVYPASAFFTNA